MKKLSSNKKLINTVAKLVLKIIWISSAIKLVILRGYLKIKNGQIPKNYSEFIYYFTKAKVIFEERDSSVKRARLELLIKLLLEMGLEGYKFWRESDLLTAIPLQKNSSYKDWRRSNYLNKNITKSIIESTAYMESKGGVLISLVMPVFKTNPKYLEECIESVVNQIYENWELIIVNDGSDSRIIENILNRYKHSESRIRVTSLEKNQGIVSATNIGIKQAKGDYVGFLDHDDLLSRDALFLVAIAIIKNPKKIDFIYTDEDKVDEKGIHYDPNFKGGFNALMARFHNYTHHLSLYSSRIIAKIGELDEIVSGAQDFDFFLRAQEFLLEEHICHIPHVCYHWRAHAESTASRGTQKKYVLDAAKKSIFKSLRRDGIDCELILPEIAKKNGWTLWQPLWRAGDITGLVTILIPTKNKGELLLNCIESIKKTCKRIPKIIIVDDNSDEPKTIEIFRLLENDIKLNIEIIKSPYSNNRFNYARLINFGAGKITTKFFIQLNNDIEAVSTNWIEQMVGWMQFKDVGVVGAKLKYPNGKLQHAGVVIGPNGGLADHQFHGLPGDLPGYTSLPHISREVSAVTGACLLTETELFRILGGFDEDNFSVEFNDVDYCLRAKEFGKKIVYAAEVELIHITSASRGNTYNPQEHINFLEKYRGYEDVYFSPNVDIDSMQMSHFSSKLIYKDITSKPRLIIFSHALSRTGAPITAIEFAIEMKSRGYEIEFVTFEDGPLKKQLIDSEIKVHNLNLSKPIYNIVYMEIEDKIKDLFLSIDIRPEKDIVISNTVLTFIAINVAKSQGIKSIWHIHENKDYLNFVSLLGDPDLRKLSIQALDEVDMVIFQSIATKQLYKKYFSHEKILKISGGMPIERIRGYKKTNEKSSVKKKLGIVEGPHVISIIGTTCDRKGQKEFLEAVEQIDWQSLKDYIGEVIVLIVGKVESDYSLVLEEQASKMKYLDIKIIDEVSNIYDYYFISDTFVCASKEESFPMVVLIAMAFNVPIVSTLAGGIGEMLQHDHDAILAVNNSSGAIKEALINSLTRDDRKIMAKKAYVKILRFFDNKIIYDLHEDAMFYLQQNR